MQYIKITMNERDIITEADEDTIDDINIGFIISVASNQYLKQNDNYLKEIDLNVAQTKVLMTLVDYENVSIDFLAKKTFMSKSSVTKSVKNLEKKGLVNKEIDENDNRKKVITVTPKGKEIQDESMRLNREIENKLEDQLGKDTLKSLKWDLRKLILTLNDF